MDRRKKKKVLDMSRRFTSEVEAALQDSPEFHSQPGNLDGLSWSLWCALYRVLYGY